jgi:S-adenosylmethionine hydrolase
MSIITLTSDFGNKDPYLGVLKGKFLSAHSEAKLVDISHEIDPFNLLEASYVIQTAYDHFPKGTVHLIAIDVEKNLEQQHVAIKFNDHYFVAADNGILTMMTHQNLPSQMVEINIHNTISSIQTDMDVLMHSAIHLSKGGIMNLIGKEIDSLKKISVPMPWFSSDFQMIHGSVIYIDHFGNVVVNITQSLFKEIGKGREFEIQIKPKPIKKIFQKYSDIGAQSKYALKDYEGSELAVFNEAGFLEIALYKGNQENVGNANTLLGLDYRDVITIRFKN